MDSKNELYRYRAFGLTIASEIEVPELLPMADTTVEPDVEIRVGPVPEALEDAKLEGVRFQAKAGQFLLCVDDIARFLVSDGRTITVAPFQGAEGRDVRLFLLGSTFGALIHQRGLLPLHASAVKVGDACAVFCGRSGAGKSTIAKALVRRGYPLHTDDICVVAPEEGGRLVAHPGYPQLKLWEDALEKVGIGASAYFRVREVLAKFAVPVGEAFHGEPLPVGRIYILAPWQRGEIEVSPVTGMGKFHALQRHTFRLRFVEGLDQGLEHFGTVGSLGDSVPVLRVHRPVGLFLLDELADVVERDLKE